jgi:serum/glucocorticoid-regulated kinase 2
LGANGQAEIQAHPWFAGINWQSLLKKEIIAEFVPVTEGSSWIDNFDKDFTKLTVRITKTPSTESNTFDDVFKDF